MYNLGIRKRLDSKPAMLTNSLFLDFLKENGLNIYKDESTRDVICIEFNCGSCSYEDEIKNSNKRKKEWKDALEAGKIEQNHLKNRTYLSIPF